MSGFGRSSTRKPTCAQILDANLEELRQMQNLESLRPFLIEESCFQNGKDARSAPITMDELKKLARVWKLNERRNFWKQHFTKEALLGALLQHIHDNNSYAGGPQFPADEEKYLTPAPPTELKPSHLSLETKPKIRVKMRRICGYPVLNPVRNHQDILTKSRFVHFPANENRLTNQLNEWRIADFGSTSPSVSEKDSSKSAVTSSSSTSQQKVEKQRALALQLLEFSLHKKNTKIPMSRENVETYLNVSETEDFESEEYCAAAISNICSNPQTRLLLIDLNAIHKYTALLPHLKSPAAAWAATLFFYYLSCESDIEDRIYNAGFNTLMMNSMSADLSLSAAALTGLANLLPCSERQRVAEQIVRSAMRFGTTHLSTHPEQSRTILSVIQRATCFTNVHATLLNLELMDFISLVVANQDRQEITSGTIISSILSNFLHSPECYEDIIQSDYVHIFIELLAFSDDSIVQECLGSLAVLSGNPDSVLAVMERDVVEVVCGLTSFRDLNKVMALYVAKYFANICRPGLGNIQPVVDAGAHAALLQLLERHYDVDIRNFTLRALRGILSVDVYCNYFCVSSIPPLISAILTREEPEAITCLQHISVVPACLPQLFSHEVHVHVLSILHSEKLKSLSIPAVVGYLRILLQIAAGSPERAQALLKMRATECLWYILQECSKPEEATSSPDRRKTVLSPEKRLYIRLTQMPEVCKIVSRVLVCLITAVGKDGSVLQPSTRDAAVDIVKLISGSGAEPVVIDECCLILASISAFSIQYTVAHTIIQNLLSCSNSDAMTESMSVVVYNMSCQESNIVGMLSDAFYLNLMIRMMRSGLVVAQENIVEAFRTLCCYEQCSKLLMKHDLLSDLIVIALLRTSSEKIKTVCCEALYNMLCQSSEIRFNLLKGDLWWAIMRLTKTDIERVREVCCSALLNLSMERDNIAALRRNHVISFLKEFSATGRGSFLEPCLISIHNILSNADTDLLHSELVIAAEVCSSGLIRSDTMLSISLSLNLLSRIIVSLTESNFGIAELSNLELAKVLWESRGYWQTDRNCRETVGFLLQVACTHNSFVSTTPLTDIIPLCNVLVYGPMAHKHFNRGSTRLGDLSVKLDPLHDAVSINDNIADRENVASILMRYAGYSGEANETALKAFLRTSLFHSTVAGPLCASRRKSVVSSPKMLESFAEEGDGDGTVADPTISDTEMDNNKVETALAPTADPKREIVVTTELKRTCVALYAHLTPLLLDDALAKLKDEAELRQYMATKTGRNVIDMTVADISFTNAWYGMLPIDLPQMYLHDPETLANISYIVSIYSGYQVLSGFLLDASLCSFLADMMDMALIEDSETPEKFHHNRYGSISGAFTISRNSKLKEPEFANVGDIDVELYGQSLSVPEEGNTQITTIWEDATPPASVLAARFCAAILRNISEHPHLMPQVVTATDIDRLLNLLLTVEDEIVARDVCILLHRAGNEELTMQTVLSPGIVYKVAKTMASKFYLGDNLCRLFRHIVAVALENFAHDIGATPENVKAVYDEMIENEGFDIAQAFRDWVVDDSSLGLHPTVRTSTKPQPLVKVGLPDFPDVSELWMMVRYSALRHLDSIEFSSQKNAADTEDTEQNFFTVIDYPVEKENPKNLLPYSKIICIYPFVDTSTGNSNTMGASKRASVARMSSHFDPFASQQSMGSSLGEFTLQDHSGCVEDVNNSS